MKKLNKLTIITPSYRVHNLVRIKNYLNFDYIAEWIIVYDGKRVAEHPHMFNDEKISEYLISGDGIEGNPQRNYGIQNIKNENTFIYFLDDDNIIHLDFYPFIDTLEDDTLMNSHQSPRHNHTMILTMMMYRSKSFT